jgi:tetratricopeptide (TPR) repeat protein
MMFALLLLLSGSFALAGDTPEKAGTETTEDDKKSATDESVSGKAQPPLERAPDADAATKKFSLPENMSYQEYRDRPYRNTAYVGSVVLQMEPEFIHLIQDGLELIYLRQYNEARTHFNDIEKKFPSTAVGAVADTLVWQALMLENFDFKFAKQYWVSSKAARADLKVAMSKPGNEAWEYFLMTGVVGIESIHTMREGQYLQALQLAFTAMDNIQKAREEAPEWPDLLLADGMYNYWRTVVTMNSKILPDFGDKRVEGIEQMQIAEKRGFFLGAPTALSLAFTWLEENDMKRAISACIRNRTKYPDNIVNNLVTGQTYIFMRRFKEAHGVFDEVLEDDPKNRRVHYYRGLTHQRSGKYDDAEKSFTTYLGVDYLEDWQKAYAHYRIGQLNNKRKQYALAEDNWKTAVKISGHKGAKKSLDRLKSQKKNGKIDY